MCDASSPGRGNNSTEIVTDVHVSVIRFLNHDHFFFFFFLGYHRMRFVIIACFFFTWRKRESCNWTYCRFGLSMN